MARDIFISYRRDDEPGMATALFLQLEKTFAEDRLFMDVEGGIAPGQDFVSVLEDQVAQCQLMLALVGKGWLSATDADGRLRLDNPDDFVRIEIESAIRLGKIIIPILINRTEMPRSAELPEPMRPFVRRHAVRITQERFRSDTQGLVEAIARVLEAKKTDRERARTELETKKRMWEEAVEQQERDMEEMVLSDDPQTLMTFLKSYPNDPRVPSVEARLRARLKELMTISNDAETLETFLKLYPNDPYAKAVKIRLMAVQNLRLGKR